MRRGFLCGCCSPTSGYVGSSPVTRRSQYSPGYQAFARSSRQCGIVDPSRRRSHGSDLLRRVTGLRSLHPGSRTGDPRPNDQSLQSGVRKSASNTGAPDRQLNASDPPCHKLVMRTGRQKPLTQRRYRFRVPATFTQYGFAALSRQSIR